MKNPCPCFSGKPYANCCEPWHLGAPAPDAERLMRSRYSAYVLKLAEYLLHTWHPDSRPASLTPEDLKGIKWLKLQVLTYRQTGIDQAEVAFVALYQQGQQKKSQLAEHSQFVRIDGRWLYLGETGS